MAKWIGGRVDFDELLGAREQLQHDIREACGLEQDFSDKSDEDDRWRPGMDLIMCQIDQGQELIAMAQSLIWEAMDRWRAFNKAKDKSQPYRTEED